MPRRIGTSASALWLRIWIHSFGSLAAIRVVSRSPLPASASAVPRCVEQPGGDQRGGDLREVRDQRDRGVVVRGVHARDRGAQVNGQGLGGLHRFAARVSACAQMTHGIEVNSSPRADAGPERSRPAIGWVPT